MKKENRQEIILDLLEKNGMVEVTELSRHFKTSEMTIRKDLNHLNEIGKLQRKYGGAKLIKSKELPLTEKQKENFAQKEVIALAASSLIENGDSLLLDAGTTTEHIAGYLKKFSRLAVISNGLNIITKIMMYENITLYLPEGKVDSNACSIVGTHAEASLKKYNAKISFIGVDGITIEQGLMNNSHEANAISSIMLKNSQKRIVLADSSKFGKIGMISLCPLDGIDILITDSGIPEAFVKAFKSAGVQIIIAPETSDKKA